MNNTKKQTLIVYIDINRIFFYAEGVRNVLQLEYPPDTLSDLEIGNREKFDKLTSSFIQTNFKGFSFNVILIFSQNASFDKDLVPQVGKEIEDQEEEFLGIVPFEEMLSKSYKLNKGTKLVAVNRGMYDMLERILLKFKYSINMVLSYSILQQVQPELASQMDFSLLLQKVATFRQYNMIDVGREEIEEKKKKDEKKKFNKRLVVMTVAFIVLLLFMLVFGYMTFFQNSEESPEGFIKAFTPTPKQEIQKNPTPSVENIPTVVPQATPSGSI